jgi:menaquinone-dependent protoporphyrinogen oxidase
MSELPVFFATTDGQTRRIAEAFAAHARFLGVDSQAIDVTSARAADFSWAPVRAVVLAASVHVGRHQAEAEAFVRRHLVELNARPSMFLSVSLAISSRLPDEIDSARKIAAALPEQLGWRPGQVVCVAGRLAYTQYGLFKRFVMRRIAVKAGGPADTSRDHEMTDWDQVRGLAAELVGVMERPARRAAAG